MISDRELLALHRELVSTPSISGRETALADRLERWMSERGWRPERLGNSVLVTAGTGPLLLLDTHIDTVPPTAGWTKDPEAATVEDGRVYGLGANDAKAAAAALLGAFSELTAEDLPITLALALVEGEETRGIGTETVLAALTERDRRPAAAVVGEPTGLDVAIAQKGLLILKLAATGDACHAAHAAALGARNAIRGLARDLIALDDLDLGPDHPVLGPTSLEPTQVEGGTARNVVPDSSAAILDLRTTPAAPHGTLIERIQQTVAHSVLEVVSRRLEPRETARHEAVVEAAVRARPAARVYGSGTMSDLVFMKGIPAVKVGPGQSERSHTPDEFALESEVLEGRRFYVTLVQRYVELVQGRGTP
jgi:acetylornithine deacetylase